MNEISEHARKAADSFILALKRGSSISGLREIIQSAIETAQNEFIDQLVTTLESHGIDATNWDGDDPPHIIIANGIAAGLEIATADKDKVIERYRRALEWYADYDNWRDDGSIRVREKGSRARAAFHPEEKRP